MQWLHRMAKIMPRRLLHMFLFFFLIFFTLTACVGAVTPQNTPAAPFSGATSWIIARSALDRLQSAGMSSSQMAAYFDNSHTYILGTQPDGWQSIITMDFTSYAAMQQSFANNQVSSSVQAIVYDPEAWSFTPLSEQQNIIATIAAAAALAHAHHKQFIVTPATDLIRVVAPATIGDPYTRFLATQIIGNAAKVADIVEIQAQGAETNLPRFTQFVAAAVAQAKAAKPDISVFVGLSTNPSGQQVTGAQLKAAFQATHTYVNGYWLNIPSSQGGYCPKCGAPQPQVAIDFLKSLGG